MVNTSSATCRGSQMQLHQGVSYAKDIPREEGKCIGKVRVGTPASGSAVLEEHAEVQDHCLACMDAETGAPFQLFGYGESP
jgi:hypothetical protein